MEADITSIRFSNTITYFRLFATVLLTPVFILVWLCISLDIVMTHFSANPSDTGRLILGMFIVMVGFALPLACMLLLGLPYTIGMSKAGRLSFLTVLLPTFPAAIISGLIVYSSLQPDRHPAPARTMTVAAALGVLVAGLCFYFVGVWRSTTIKPLPPTSRRASKAHVLLRSLVGWADSAHAGAMEWVGTE